MYNFPLELMKLILYTCIFILYYPQQPLSLQYSMELERLKFVLLYLFSYQHNIWLQMA